MYIINLLKLKKKMNKLFLSYMIAFAECNHIETVLECLNQCSITTGIGIEDSKVIYFSIRTIINHMKRYILAWDMVKQFGFEHECDMLNNNPIATCLEYDLF